MEWREVVGKAINAHDIRLVPDTSLQECMELCMADQPDCRSVNYMPVERKCYHGDVRFGDLGIYSWVEGPKFVHYAFCELGEYRKSHDYVYCI